MLKIHPPFSFTITFNLQSFALVLHGCLSWRNGGGEIDIATKGGWNSNNNQLICTLRLTFNNIYGFCLIYSVALSLIIPPGILLSLCPHCPAEDSVSGAHFGAFAFNFC